MAMDKVATKKMLRGGSVRLIPDATWRRGEPLPSMELPVVVKAPNGGSTIGIEFAKTEPELESALNRISELEEPLLVERLVTGEEITVAVLDGHALPVVSIRPVGGAHFDFEAKYTEGKTRYEVPAAIEDGIKHAASVAAVVAYQTLGCRGLARADFIVPEGGGDPVFLEINTLPGMTATSLSPMAAGANGTSFEALVEQILLAATCMEAEVES